MEKDIEDLLRRYRANQCSDEERRWVERVYIRHIHNERYMPDEVAKAEVWDRLQVMRHKERHPERRKLWPYWLTSAAAALLVAAAAFYFMDLQGNKKEDLPASTEVADVQPGGNKATLTLSDGSTVDLSSEQTGIIVGDGITYADGSGILDNKQQTADNRHTGEKESLMSDVSRPMSLTTPKGGQYQVTLPDGTKVWLNAASTLKYPSRFSDRERVVEVSGEAFFQVSTDRKRPFRVLSKGQEIKVLGTEFNINAYEEQQETSTTLISGAVKVQSSSQAVVLKPGEQSRADGSGRLTSRTVDADVAVAWKSGLFYFKRTPFEEVMKQVARWYDVEVIYKNDIPGKTFSGKMKRDVKLSSVLDMMEGSGIRFQIDGNKLMID